MKIKIGTYILPLLAAALLTFSIIQVVRGQQKPTQPAPPIPPPQTPFGKTVAGAGIVEAQTEDISIGSPLPGIVLEVYVPVEKVGQLVEKDTPLFLVDTRQLQAQRDLQKANVLAAEAQLAKLEAQPRQEEVPPAEAALKAAQFNFAVQQDTAKRNSELIKQNAVPGKDYEQSLMLAQLANHQMLQAKANLTLLKAGAWEPDKAIARANVAVARAQLKSIETDIERSTVCAPVKGKVLQVNVLPGQYVGTPPAQALVVLGSIEPLHIRVDIDEHDIPRAYRFFKKGVPAWASPRGDPSMKFPLTFVRIEPYVIPKKSLTGDNTERVDTRVLQVIYAVDHKNAPLCVGMQVDVFIDAGGGD